MVLSLNNAGKRFGKYYIRSMSSSPYPHLLKPLELKSGHVMRNRVLMGSMHTGLEEAGSGVFGSGPLDRMAAYFAERLFPSCFFSCAHNKFRARGGVGIIVTGGVAPNKAGKGHLTAGMMTSDSDVANHRPVTQAVHDSGGLIAMQILHTGRYYIFSLIA